MILIDPSILTPERRNDDYDPFWRAGSDIVQSQITMDDINKVIDEVEMPSRLCYTIQSEVWDELDKR